MNDPEDVQRLIRLKRFETPGDAYYERFLDEFKDRQRAELLQQSSFSLLTERVTMWLDQLPTAARLGAPIGAAAALTLFFVATNFGPTQEVPAGSSLVGAQPVEPAEQALPAFPEAEEETIELTLPKANSTIPPAWRGSDGLLPATVRGSLREL